MHIFASILVFLSLVTGGYGNCSTSEELQEGTTMYSPGYPELRPRHSCKKYRYAYTSPPGTTISIGCPEFSIQCRGQRNYLKVTGGTRKCGKTFPKVTMADNSLTIEVSARTNKARASKKRSVVIFKCEIEVHYPKQNSACDCPAPEPVMSTRIISGTDAKEGEFPYQVALTYNNELVCGGSLIAATWVVTSAQYHIDTRHEARMGFVDLSKVSPNEVTRKIKAVITHPDFHFVNLHFDIALAELDEPVTFTPFIRPICLPYGSLDEHLSRRVATATGWGRDETGSYPNVLQKVTLDIINNYDCAVIYGSDIYDESICTLTKDKDTCKRDGGGPLAYTDDDGRVYLVGGSSFGLGCAIPDTPSVYTRVSSAAVLKWIKDTIGVKCDNPPTSVAAQETYSCEVCGQRKSSFFHSRVVNGMDAQEGEFPYLVSFIDKYNEHYCGGSLISNRWVVTAVHCEVNKYLDRVVLGQHKASEVSANQKVFRIASVLDHPRYIDAISKFDVSLVQLDEPVAFTDYIKPICLPDSFSDESLEGEFVEASGWGALKRDGDYPDVLQKVTLEVISNFKCRVLNGRNVFPTSFCTLTIGKDTCQGDSGGPLAYQQGGRLYLVGVTSWGYGCALSMFPGVSVRVAHPSVLVWIKNNAGITCNAP